MESKNNYIKCRKTEFLGFILKLIQENLRNFKKQASYFSTTSQESQPNLIKFVTTTFFTVSMREINKLLILTPHEIKEINEFEGNLLPKWRGFLCKGGHTHQRTPLVTCSPQ